MANALTTFECDIYRPCQYRFADSRWPHTIKPCGVASAITAPSLSLRQNLPPARIHRNSTARAGCLNRFRCPACAMTCLACAAATNSRLDDDDEP